MPEIDQAEIVLLSQQIAQARNDLLSALQNQLDELLSEKLIPQATGVPFINFNTDPPQVSAIKKVINCLYHSEIAAIHYENLDASTVWATAKSIPQAIMALIQVHRTLASLDDASPEIRAVIADNYNLIAPIFSKTYEIVKDSGWASEFAEMEVTDKASTVINQGVDLLGPDPAKWNNTNPLVSTFEKIAKIMGTISKVHEKSLSKGEQEELAHSIRSLFDDLDNNALLRQLTFNSLEESKAITDLMAWFKNIEDDGFAFTRKSMQHYISWTNHYLPPLLVSADQLERNNYLKSGILSQNLSSAADSLTKEINKLLASSPFNITERAVTVDSLNELREREIYESQVKNVRAIHSAEAQQKSAGQFFSILRAYAGTSFSEIIESDRAKLRTLYPKLQMILAHANLDVENQFTVILNQIGPEKLKEKDNSWWGLAVKAVGYVGSFAMGYEVDKLLATKDFVDYSIKNQIDSEQFKLKIAEKARSNLKPSLDKDVKISLDQRVAERRKIIEKDVMTHVPDKQSVSGEFVAIKPFNLNNLRGTLTQVQKMELSSTVNQTRKAVDILLRRVSKEDQVHFSKLPHLIHPEDPAVIVQIKTVKNNLFELEKTLIDFESRKLGDGLLIHLRSYLLIASAAVVLKRSVKELAPDAQKYLAPTLQQLKKLSTGSEVFSKEEFKAKETVVQVREAALTTTVEIKAKATVDAVTIVEAKAEARIVPFNDQDYIKQINSARALLLNKFKTTLALPLSNSLTPQKEGVPFIEIDRDPPQIAALKKMINSMYYAELGIKIWQSMDTSTPFGKIAAAPRGICAITSV